MENKRPNNKFIGRYKSEMRCKKHPKHMQAPGVCSVCLGERLSQLSASSSRKNANKVSAVSSCSSLSSLSSSGYSSTEESPVHQKYRLGSMKNEMMSGPLRGRRDDMFKKSKSIAAVEMLKRGEAGSNKKKGFWSKLLRHRRESNSSKITTTRVY